MTINLSSSLTLTWGWGDIGKLVDTWILVVNGGTKDPISGCVIAIAVVETVVGEVTPISVETGFAMVAPITVDTLAPTVGAYACVDCACEEDCDDCDDAKVSLLVGRAISFKALPLIKCMHIKVFFLEKVY